MLRVLSPKIILPTALLCSFACNADANSYIYRYHDATISTSNQGTPPASGGENTDPIDPDEPTGVACGAAAGSTYGCLDGQEEPSTTGMDSIKIVLTTNSAKAAPRPYQCMHVSGGYGNFVFSISPSGNSDWIDSIDIVPADDLDAPESGNTTDWTQYPGYDDTYDYISPTNEVCVRFTPKPGYVASADREVSLSFWVSDYADNAVEDGKANWNENDYDSEKEVAFLLRSVLIGQDDTNSPGNSKVVSFDTIGSTTYSNSFYPVTIAWSDADSFDGVSYQCFDYQGGVGTDNMQYGVTADTGVPGWVKWYDVVPLSEVDATHEAVANNTGAFDAYWPTYFFADTLGIFTASKQICLRMAINHASAEASSLKLTMHTIEDNHQTAEFHVITKPVYPGE